MYECEKCGKEYWMRTISENRGKHLCRDCLSHCLKCGEKLPRSNFFGERSSLTGAFLGPLAGPIWDTRNPSVGTGICNRCFYEKEKIKPSKKKQKTSEL